MCWRTHKEAPATSPRARSPRSRGTREPRRAVTCSSAGARFPDISEFSPSGKVLFNAELPTGSAPTASTCCPGARLADYLRAISGVSE